MTADIHKASMDSVSLKVENLLICSACGTQFSITAESGKTTCRICLDPRQYIPPSGQRFTTLADVKNQGFKNEWKAWFQDKNGEGALMSFMTTPKFAIGERAFLIQTPAGNVLWDLIALLDDETTEKIQKFGGLAAIVISHPHYYTTYVEWARVFGCPVYFGAEDAEWLDRMDVQDIDRRWINATTETILPGITAIKCGGHFDGSLVLHWESYGGSLFIADTVFTVPSGRNPNPRTYNQTTYSFMYSIPNMIPLTADAIQGIWNAIKPFKFKSTYGAFSDSEVHTGSVIKVDGSIIEEQDLRQRMLESMKIVVRAQIGAMETHGLLDESLEL